MSFSPAETARVLARGSPTFIKTHSIYLKPHVSGENFHR